MTPESKPPTGGRPADAVPARGRRRIAFGNLGNIVGSLASLIILCIFFQLQSDVFLTEGNILNVLRQGAFIAILSAGMTFVILTGGVDLSVGSIVILSAMVGGILIVNEGWSMWPALLVMLAIGTLCGLLNGLIITFGKIPPFIVTLGTMQIYRGAALQILGNDRVARVSQEEPNFTYWGQGSFAGVPNPIIITGLVFLAGYLILRYTRLGLYTYAIGGNEQATRFSGVNVIAYKLAVYTLMGLAAGIASVVFSSRLNSVPTDTGSGAELDAIAAVIIGGTSLFGGEGSIAGTLIGALLLAVIRNGLTLMQVGAFYQQIIIGAVIIGAVLIDRLRRRGAS